MQRFAAELPVLDDVEPALLPHAHEV